MSERFCPFCGRANRSDLPRCMNCGQRMVPTPPTTQAAVTGGRSILLEETDETQTVASRTGNHEPWWRTPEGSPFGSIPPPPQVREEMARFEARESAKEAAKRAEQAAKNAAAAHARKKAAEAVLRAAEKEQAAKAASQATNAAFAKNPITGASVSHMECVRCGTVPPPGGGFSFCLSCGGDLTSTGSPIFNGTAKVNKAAKTTPTSVHSSAAPSVAGVRKMHEAETKGMGGRVSLASAQGQAGYFPPGVAAVLSFFVPGIGQIINGQVAKGVVLLLASFFVSTVLGVATMGLLPIIGRVVAALDAYRVAERRRKGEVVRPDEWDLG